MSTAEERDPRRWESIGDNPKQKKQEKETKKRQTVPSGTGSLITSRFPGTSLRAGKEQRVPVVE